MKNIVTAFVKLLMLFCFVVGSALIYRSQSLEKIESESHTNKKVLALKKHLLTYNKPQRVEITNLTQRFAADVEEIKKMKVNTSANSSFYIAIDFFTDENDPKAPLIAQIKFIEISSGNKLKEDNINLE